MTPREQYDALTVEMKSLQVEIGGKQAVVHRYEKAIVDDVLAAKTPNVFDKEHVVRQRQIVADLCARLDEVSAARQAALLEANEQAFIDEASRPLDGAR